MSVRIRPLLLTKKGITMSTDDNSKEYVERLESAAEILRTIPTHMLDVKAGDLDADSWLRKRDLCLMRKYTTV